MRKKVLSMLMAVVMACGISIVVPTESAMAAEREETIIDGSILLDNATESIGEAVLKTRGKYLQSGSSRIVEVGTGKIGVGATTIAHTTVSTLKAAVMVERLVNGSWVSYTSWTATKSNGYSLSTSKTLTVPRGYYYRVRTIHVAASDSATSNTSGLYIS